MRIMHAHKDMYAIPPIMGSLGSNVCVCVCVCVCERERERERVCVFVWCVCFSVCVMSYALLKF